MLIDRMINPLFVSSSLKQLSSGKKEKDGEDKKRNPILKYIGKPRSTSQSSKGPCRHTKHTKKALHSLILTKHAQIITFT